MSDKDWGIYIEHMLQAVREILEDTEGMNEEGFLDNRTVMRAVERNIQILGQAANKMPEAIQSKYPDIPWRAIRNTRNIVVHEYTGIEYETIWNIIEAHLPALKTRLESIDLPDIEED